MKLELPNKRNEALTIAEVLVIVALLALLTAILLPLLAGARHRSPSFYCRANLNQVNLAFRIWAGDNNDKYPMEVSITNGGAMESVATGDVVNCFLAMSNELSTPKILCCPEDPTRTPATNFENGFDNSHISYFIGLDSDETHPQRLMSGDDNFQLNSVTVPSGLFQFATNAPIAWSPDRHVDVRRIPYLRIPTSYKIYGNLGLADGSVSGLYTPGLQRSLVETGLATNRFAIP